MIKSLLSAWELLKNKELDLEIFACLISIVLKKEWKDPDVLKKTVQQGYLDAAYNLTEKGLLTYSTLMVDYQKIFNTDLNSKNVKVFEAWWDAYPRNDGHAHYPRTRTLRTDRDTCFQLYIKALQKGFTPDDLLKALKEEVQSKKRASLNKNELSFMKKSVNYLEQGEYEGWIDSDSSSEQKFENNKNTKNFF